MTRHVNTDLVAGLVGLAFWFSRGRLGPLSSIFPEAILVVTAIVSTMLLAKALLRPSVRAIFNEGDQRRLAVLTLILFAWWWFIDWLGFGVASVLAMLAIVWYLASVEGQVRLPRLALWLAVVIVEVGLFYIVFTRLLYIRPPRGLFF
jgi:hypothetical protein